MRVLQILHGSEAGGARTLAEIVGEGLAARGIAVEVATLFPDAEPGRPAKLLGALRLAGRILAQRYDALIAYQPSASILAGIVGWIGGCRTRVVHQTALPSEVKVPMRWLDRAVGTLGLYTANVANSAATRAAFARYPSRYRRAMILIEHGVPAPRPLRSRTATLRRFAVPDNGRVLLNVGRLTAQKNQGVLIEALAHLPHGRLVVAGDGPLRADYKRLAGRLRVAERLHLLGDVAREEVADLLAASDVFVFPSTWETFGLAVVEAAIAGLPIVAADLPVLREVLAGGIATFAPPGDADAWARRIAASLDQTRPRNTTSPDPIARRYSVPRMIDAYVAVLQSSSPAAAAPTSPPRHR